MNVHFKSPSGDYTAMFDCLVASGTIFTRGLKVDAIYIPVVEKEVRWTKRCKDPALVGTVKERIHQVSMSKKWASQPAIGEDGQPLLTKSGKPVLRKSYSVLQDDFYNAMRAAGYTELERGERGSSEEHLTVTEF